MFLQHLKCSAVVLWKVTRSWVHQAQQKIHALKSLQSNVPFISDTGIPWKCASPSLIRLSSLLPVCHGMSG